MMADSVKLTDPRTRALVILGVSMKLLPEDISIAISGLSNKTTLTNLVKHQTIEGPNGTKTKRADLLSSCSFHLLPRDLGNL